MHYICLMLVDEKNRKFFTPKKNKMLLDDFINKFNIKTYTVKTKKENIKDIDDIVKFYCDQSYDGSDVDYTLVKSNTKPKKQKKPTAKKLQPKITSIRNTLSIKGVEIKKSNKKN